MVIMDESVCWLTFHLIRMRFNPRLPGAFQAVYFESALVLKQGLALSWESYRWWEFGAGLLSCDLLWLKRHDYSGI